jgi:GTPase involved in cell partitioning and DNA repair
MPTPYSNIYTKSSVLFEDAGLLSVLSDVEYEELLEQFLSKSKSIYFKNCKKDLTDVDNTLKQFNQTLSDEEEWILAEGIKLVWLEKQLNKEEKLRDKLTTKDYNSSHSTGNLIDKLSLLVENARKNLTNMTVSYSFNSFEGFL